MISSKTQSTQLFKSKLSIYYESAYNLIANRNNQFNLDELIKCICNKLRNSRNKEVLFVLIKWIEVLYSVSNVNIL